MPIDILPSSFSLHCKGKMIHLKDDSSHQSYFRMGWVTLWMHLSFFSDGWSPDTQVNSDIYVLNSWSELTQSKPLPEVHTESRSERMAVCQVLFLKRLDVFITMRGDFKKTTKKPPSAQQLWPHFNYPWLATCTEGKTDCLGRDKSEDKILKIIWSDFMDCILEKPSEEMQVI